MKRLFGTDGIRGEAGHFPLDRDTVEQVGASLGAHLREKLERKPLIVTGRDPRESGTWIESSFIAGATHAGASCKSAGVITTPGVAFLTRTLMADAGVVISASHNPYQDNGIKIFATSGQKLDDSVERLIEADVFASPPLRRMSQPNMTISSPECEKELQQEYLSFLANEIGEGLNLNGFKMVVDCANGASSILAPLLFARLGAKVIPINAAPDGRNINRDCGSLHIDALRQQVVKEVADFGVAFDGDADRSLFVDREGDFVDGDGTLWVLARHLQSHGQLKDNIVVATVMSNVGLEIAFRAAGIRLVRTDVGDKYVLDELLRLDASVGGEQSGHIILPDLSLAGDGMITTLCLLRALRDSGKTLSEMTAGFKPYSQILLNVRVRQKRPLHDLVSLQPVVREIETTLGDRGRLLLRYSGTEPLLRIMIEGEDSYMIEAFANRLAEQISKELS